MNRPSPVRRWLEAAAVYRDPRVIAIMFLGFSSGLPLLLTFSTLSIWLKEVGVSKTAIGLFALVGMPYTFKFLWAPLVDHLRIPFLTARLGPRRSWMILTQLALMAAIVGLGTTNPVENLGWTAILSLAVTFCSASQDIVIDAYRVEILEERQYGAGAATIVFGYRIGMLASGAGALYLASSMSWSAVYAVMGGLVTVGIMTVLLNPEPARAVHEVKSGAPERGSWLSDTAAWIQAAAVNPFLDFMRRRGWVIILLFVIFYKLGDTLAGTMANPFYIELQFTKIEIANISKLFGLGATLLGGFLGGILVTRAGIMRSLLVCGVLQMLSNLMFAIQAMVGHSVPMLTLTIGIENLSGGMGTAAFVAYLSSLCSAAYTATQYALLSALMSLPRTMLSASAGWLADHLDWVTFFLLTTAAAVPGLLLLLWLMRREEAGSPQPQPVPVGEDRST